MKKLALLSILLFICLMLFPRMGLTLGFDGIGGKVAYVIPPDDDLDNTMGFGVVVDLGTIIPQMSTLKAEASADYWGESYVESNSEVQFTSLGFHGTAKYFFSSTGMRPFAGAGLGLLFANNLPGVDDKSKTDLGLHLCGGIDIPIGPGTKIIAEGRYTMGGADALQIIGAFVVKLK